MFDIGREPSVQFP